MDLSKAPHIDKKLFIVHTHPYKKIKVAKQKQNKYYCLLKESCVLESNINIPNQAYNHSPKLECPTERELPIIVTQQTYQAPQTANNTHSKDKYQVVNHRPQTAINSERPDSRYRISTIYNLKETGIEGMKITYDDVQKWESDPEGIECCNAWKNWKVI